MKAHHESTSQNSQPSGQHHKALQTLVPPPTLNKPLEPWSYLADEQAETRTRNLEALLVIALLIDNIGALIIRMVFWGVLYSLIILKGTPKMI